MTISKAQMYRQLYQMGGIGTLPMDYGQSLQVNNQGQAPMPNYSSAVNITANPLLNYGQTSLNQGGGTPLTMRSGGITRLGYANGDIVNIEDQMMQQSQMQQPQQPPLEGIMGAMPKGDEKGQTALLTIIQLLIEQGVPPEQARELAMQILDAFNRGGAPAVEEFANQLEQQETQAMASGGIAGYAQRQNYGFGKFVKGIVGGAAAAVKGVANAVKSVAKSPIGMIALSIAAPYAIGAMFPGFATLGGTGFLGSALRAGISNLAIQGITTGKINPKQALMAAVGGGIAGEFFPQGTPAGDVTQSGVTGAPNLSDVATPTEIFQPGPQTTLTSGVTGGASNLPYGSSTAVETYGPQGMTNVGPVTEAGKAYTNPTIGDRISQFGDTVRQGITNLYEDPLGTIGRAASSAYDYAKANALPLTAGAVAGGAFRAQLPGEPDDEYNKLKAEHDAKVSGYITQYGGGVGLRSSPFYTMEKAVDPFAGTSLGKVYTNNPYYRYAEGGRANFGLGGMFKQVASQVAQPVEGGSTTSDGGFGMGLMTKLIQQNPQMFANTSSNLQQRYRDLISTNFIDENRNGIDDRREAAYGGRMSYGEGTPSLEKQYLEKKGYGDMLKGMSQKEILDLYDSVVGTFSRRFQAEGSMPMGEPRKNPAGIMELDYRKKGGFVPPVGIKEKADDIPAMLSNNEFVFTANAVRNAGRGNVNKGARRMYSLMKHLEAGGSI